MRLRIPLYGKILFWFFVNLALLVALAGTFVGMQFRLGLDWLLAGQARQQLEAMGEVIAGDLRGQPKPVWDEVLARYRAAHGTSFTIFRNDGRQAAGEPLVPPDEVLQKLRDRRGPPRGPVRSPRADRQVRPPEATPADAPPPARSQFMLRTSGPVRYWVGIHIGLTDVDPPDPRPVTLVVMSDRFTGGGLFFDPAPWLILGGAALLLSALVWLPVVSGITRTIRRVNTAARRIAAGGFEVRVPDSRRDELGELGSSVNAMAAQLGELIERQRRITADVAHELCSPIARMQRALGIVEQRAVPEQAGYLAKLDAELQHMARLVEEVLSFTRMAALPALATPEDFALADLVAEVLSREAAGANVEVDIPPELRLHTIREALDRALSNVVRNAARYAAAAGPIELRADSSADGVKIVVRDHGPGIPADALEKIFEPFYRPEAARQRTTGGSGLGLAIVRRCLSACGGTVIAEQAVLTGLIVTLSLPRVAPDSPPCGRACHC